MLKRDGVHPEWVQVGNEITGGMLWPLGKYDQWDNLAQLLKAGHDAVSQSGKVNAGTPHDHGAESLADPIMVDRSCEPVP